MTFEEAVLVQIEEWLKIDQPLKVFNLLNKIPQEKETDTIRAWKKKIVPYIEHAFDKEKYRESYQIHNELEFDDWQIPLMDKTYPRIKEAKEIIVSENIKTICDVGCAKGENTLYFQSLGYDCTGINITVASVEAAKIKAARMKLDAKFILGDFMDYGGDSFDCILFMEILEHVQSPKDSLAKIWSMLNPGGSLFVSTPREGFWGTKGNDDIWDKPGWRGHLRAYTEESLRADLEGYPIKKFLVDNDDLYFVWLKKE